MNQEAINHSHPQSKRVIRLFIVEDYHLIRMGLISSLEGFPSLKFVGESESAEEALEQLETYPADNPGVDVLILDLGLPGMNGIEMAQIVRKRWPDIKIVILTSHNQPEEVFAALGAGAQAYALKDIKPNRLAQVIESVHEGAAWLDPSIAATVLVNLSDNSANSGQRLGATPSAQDTAVVDKAAALDLTEREKEVLQLIVQGMNNQDISDTLSISIHTTKAHVGNILSKLSVNDRVQAAIKALKENIV